MPRFAANVTTMFQELGVPARFPAARESGFSAVEFLWPYEWSVEEISAWLTDNSLELILINTPTGEGETGLAALPGREAEFRALFEQTLHYAATLSVPMIHLMAGRNSAAHETSEDLFIEHVRWAADLASEHNIDIMLEPLNTRDMPGYLHTRSDHTAQIINTVDRENVKLQFDLYHMQIMEGDLAAGLARHLDIIGHVQFSSLPGRHEPQYGEVNLPYLFAYLDELGYAGWIGCEYWARGGTIEGLSWGKPYGLG